MRVGMGYDIHRLAPGCPLVLGGVTIPHTHGLVGHSDADVVAHAIMDALLGAAGLPDIGVHFPPGDERFRDSRSVDLLRTVRARLARAACTIVNIDVVIVAERPRLAPYRDAMIAEIAGAASVEPALVGLQVTTNEGLGPEGRGEAISARAVALVETST